MTKCENNARDPVRARQKLDGALALKGTTEKREGEKSCRGEKELSRRATAPRGINESNKFRGLLKLKFDLRPTGDYRRAKLPLSRLERADKWIAPNSDSTGDSRVLSREKSSSSSSSWKRHHHSQRIIQSWQYACKFLSDVFGRAPSRRMLRVVSCWKNASRDKLKCLKLESNQARKHRLLTKNAGAALFTRNWLNLLRNKLCIHENYDNRWSNYVAITVFLAEHTNKEEIKKNLGIERITLVN